MTYLPAPLLCVTSRDLRDRLLVVLNKSDLPAQVTGDEVAGLLPNVPLVHASAATHGGVAELENAMVARVLGGRSASSDVPLVTNVRHRDALLQAADHLTGAVNAARAGTPAAFVAVDIHAALDALGTITGETVGEDLLDVIFREFCIGK